MIVIVNRPPDPPIESVTITFTPTEAKDWLDFVGVLSTNMIAANLRTTDSAKVNRIRDMVGTIFNKLDNSGLREAQ